MKSGDNIGVCVGPVLSEMVHENDVSHMPDTDNRHRNNRNVNKIEKLFSLFLCYVYLYYLYFYTCKGSPLALDQ